MDWTYLSSFSSLFRSSHSKFLSRSPCRLALSTHSLSAICSLAKSFSICKNCFTYTHTHNTFYSTLKTQKPEIPLGSRSIKLNPLLRRRCNIKRFIFHWTLDTNQECSTQVQVIKRQKLLKVENKRWNRHQPRSSPGRHRVVCKRCGAAGSPCSETVRGTAADWAAPCSEPGLGLTHTHVAQTDPVTSPTWNQRRHSYINKNAWYHDMFLKEQ